MSAANVVVSGGTMFIVYRLMLKELGAEALGLWSVLLASAAGTRITDLGLGASALKFVAQYAARDDREGVRGVVETAGISIGVGVGLLAVGLKPVLGWLLEYLVQDPGRLLEARQLLPWILMSVWVSVMGNVLHSALDGINRIDLQNIVVMGGTLFYLIGAYLLLPRYGLRGLVFMQIGQAVFMAASAWLLLRTQGIALPIIPWRWSRSKFREMMRYGVNFQITSVCILITEPITKLFVSAFGSLSEVAYFEMANQFVQKLRLILVAGNQAIVPRLAQLAEIQPDRVQSIYQLNLRLVRLVSIPYFFLIVVLMKQVSLLWIGSPQPQFIYLGWLLAVAWGINMVSTPAYFTNLATGRLKGNVISHGVMVVVSIGLALIFGPHLGGSGVAMGYALAIVSGSMAVVAVYNRENKVRRSTRRAGELAGALAVTATAGLLCFGLQEIIDRECQAWLADMAGRLAMISGMLFVYALVVGVWLWRHSLRHELQRRLMI